MQHALLVLVLLGFTACNGGGSGCFEVGGRRVGNLDAALERAEDGDVISVCEGTLRMPLVVTGRRLTLRGQGPDLSHFELDGLVPAALIDGGSDITIEGFSAISGTSVFISSADSRLALNNVVVLGSGGYAVDAVDTEVLLNDVSVTAAAFGGVRVTGGSLQAKGLSVSDSSYYGLVLTDRAVASVTDLTVTNIDPDEGSQGDSWAARATSGASLALTNADLRGSVTGLLIDTGSLSVDGLTMQSQQFGIVLDSAGPSTISNATLNGARVWGLTALSSAALTLTNTSVTVDPGRAIAPTLTPSSSFADGSVGALFVDTSATWAGGTISGHRGAGLLSLPQIKATLSLALSDLVIEDVGRSGIYGIRTQLGLDNVQVNGVSPDPATCRVADALVCNTGVRLEQGSLSATGLSITDPSEAGLVLVQSAGTLDSLDVSGATYLGFYAQESEVNAGAVSIATAPSSIGLALSEGTAATLGALQVSGDGDLGIEVRDGAALSAANLTLSGPAQAISVAQGTLDVSGGALVGPSTFGEGQSTLRGLSLSGAAGPILTCTGGLRLVDVSLTSPGDGISAQRCALDATRTAIDAGNIGISALDSELLLEDTTINAGAEAIAATYAITAPSVFFERVTVPSAGADAISLTAVQGAPPTAFFRLQDLNLGGNPGDLGADGLVLTGISSLDLAGLTVGSPTGAGLRLDGCSGTLAAGPTGALVSVRDAGAGALQIIGGDLSLSDLDLLGSTGFDLSCTDDPLLATCDGTIGDLDPACSCP